MRHYWYLRKQETYCAVFTVLCQQIQEKNPKNYEKGKPADVIKENEDNVLMEVDKNREINVRRVSTYR